MTIAGLVVFFGVAAGIIAAATAYSVWRARHVARKWWRKTGNDNRPRK